MSYLSRSEGTFKSFSGFDHSLIFFLQSRQVHQQRADSATESDYGPLGLHLLQIHRRPLEKELATECELFCMCLLFLMFYKDTEDELCLCLCKDDTSDVTEVWVCYSVLRSTREVPSPCESRASSTAVRRGHMEPKALSNCILTAKDMFQFILDRAVLFAIRHASSCAPRIPSRCHTAFCCVHTLLSCLEKLPNQRYGNIESTPRDISHDLSRDSGLL